MSKLVDFDITQIDKDTKAVVFRIPFSEAYADEETAKIVEAHLVRIGNDLHAIGIKALFIDDSISVEPLTHELLSCGQLKQI